MSAKRRDYRRSGQPRATLETQLRGIRRAAARYREQLERGDAVGRITVPRLGLNAIVVEGTDSATLTKGPGRYTRSYVPGEGELIYIAGHRTTYGAPLAHIDRMRKGDRGHARRALRKVRLPRHRPRHRARGRHRTASSRRDGRRSRSRRAIPASSPASATSSTRSPSASRRAVARRCVVDNA